MTIPDVMRAFHHGAYVATTQDVTRLREITESASRMRSVEESWRAAENYLRSAGRTVSTKES